MNQNKINPDLKKNTDTSNQAYDKTKDLEKKQNMASGAKGDKFQDTDKLDKDANKNLLNQPNDQGKDRDLANKDKNVQEKDWTLGKDYKGDEKECKVLGKDCVGVDKDKKNLGKDAEWKEQGQKPVNQKEQLGKDIYTDKTPVLNKDINQEIKGKPDLKKTEEQNKKKF